ncbi:MAG: pseudouridine synthase [Henriciella sp.]
MHIPPPYTPPPEADLTSLFVDDDIIVADKPSGLLSVPGRGGEKATCAESLLAERHGSAFTVHRLDMDTSGVMVFARTKAAQRALSICFQKRLPKKQYTAIVEGAPQGDSGTIALPIAKFSHQRPLRHIDKDGQEAITHWQVIERDNNKTRLKLTPETGRSHQLRLHLSAIGHPILGDPFYGDTALAKRLLLHADTLSFPHPKTMKPIRFKAKSPF